jgi:hypothetical protein
VSTLPVHELNTSANELNLGSAKVYHLPDWHKLSHPERLGVMRQIAKMRGRDPRIAKLALSIIRRSGAKPRQYEKQASALLKWVQNPKNCYYINEPGERLQDPIYTIKVKHGDCDDMVLLLCCLFEAVNLPWKQVLSGQGPKGKIRYIEGERVPSGVAWTHIYCMVGTPPFQPNRWYFCEPTVQGVPLGWDVISGDHRFLPEMVKRKRGGPQVVMPSPSAPLFHRPPKMPAMKNRSPAYDAAYGGIPNPGGIGGAIGGSVAAEIEDHGFNWKGVLMGVATGVAIAVTTQLVLDTLRSQEWYPRPRPRPMGAA